MRKGGVLMIELTNSSGVKTFVAPTNIASITEACASSQWHGTRSIVRMFDGQVVEASQRASELVEAVRLATKEQP